MTITQLEYVLAVDKFKHFGRAAKECHVAQPTLSLQLQKLEQELDIVVFDRSKNPILPTAQGKTLIAQAKVVISEFNKISALLDSTSETLSGDFTLGVIPTLAPYVIPLFTENFMHNYPEVSLKIREMQTHQVVDALKSDAIDAGLLVTPLRDDQLVEKALFYEPFLAYVSDKSSLISKSKVSQKDIETNDLWILTEGHCFRNQVLNICQGIPGGNQKSVKYESGSIETVMRLVDHSGGHTLIPYLASVEGGVNKKQVKELRGINAVREVSLVYSRLFLKERIINALEEEILECIPKELKSYKKTTDVISIEL